MNNQTMKPHKLNFSIVIEYIPLLFLILTAAIFRMYAIDYGLPYLYGTDENFFVNPVLEMLENRSIDPGWYAIPASTTMYILAITYLIVFVIGSFSGTYESYDVFIQSFNLDPTIFYLSGRITIIFFAILSVILVYYIGKRLLDRRLGFVAGLLVAILPLHLEISYLIRPDIQTSFFVLLVFWFCLNILEEQKKRDYFLAGFFLGLAVVSKYPGAIAVVLIFISHLLAINIYFKLFSYRVLIISGLSCLFGIFIGSPLFYLSLRLVYTGIRHEGRSTHLSATGYGPIQDFIFYLEQLAVNDLMLFGTVLLIVGVFFTFASKQKSYVLMLLYVVVFLLSISVLSLRQYRWIIPIIPFIAIIVAYGLIEVSQLVLKRLNLWIAIPINSIILLALFLPPMSSSVTFIRELAGPDTRTIARGWMIENLTSDSIILRELYAPQRLDNNFHYYGMLSDSSLFDPSDYNDQNTYEGNSFIGAIDANKIINSDVDYFVITSIYERYLAAEESYPYEVANYRTLIANSQLIYEVYPISGQIGGPPIRIYHVE